MTVAGTAGGAGSGRPVGEAGGATGASAASAASQAAVPGDPAAAVPAAQGERGAAPPARLLNIANVLTILRLVLVPVFVLFLFVGPDDDGWRIAAFAAYAVAAVTDQIDGWIARSRGLVTDFGTLVDPIADKALTGAALVSLSILGELSWVVTAVIVLREVGVTLLRLSVIRHGVIAASRGGKIKTLLLNIALGLAVLPLTGVGATISSIVLAAGVVVAVVTGIDYVARALALRRAAAATAGEDRDAG